MFPCDWWMQIIRTLWKRKQHSHRAAFLENQQHFWSEFKANDCVIQQLFKLKEKDKIYLPCYTHSPTNPPKVTPNSTFKVITKWDINHQRTADIKFVSGRDVKILQPTWQQIHGFNRVDRAFSHSSSMRAKELSHLSRPISSQRWKTHPLHKVGWGLNEQFRIKYHTNARTVDSCYHS